MKPVSIHDYYQTRRCYGESSMDYASLTDFYLPLIGTAAFGAYQALIREEPSTKTHDSFLGFLNLTIGEFEKAIAALEAVGLVRTFVSRQDDARLFVYCLYAPLHAAEFAGDIMLSGTLKGKIGLEEYRRILARHQGAKAVEDMEEVSVSFPEHFQPSFDAKYYLSEEGKDLGTSGKALARTGFDAVAFVRELEALGIRKNALSEEELAKVGQIASLYSIGESLLAELCRDAIQVNAPKGKKLNVEALTALCYKATFVPSLQRDKGESSNVQGDTETAKMIRIMDQTVPSAFLKIMQKGHNPAQTDLKLLQHLSLDIGLPSPCVNALVFYVLSTKENTLPSAYCEKLAAALVREGCRSARDAMDYFARGKRRKGKTSLAPKAPQKVAEPIIMPSDEEDVSDEAVEAALNELFEG